MFSRIPLLNKLNPRQRGLFFAACCIVAAVMFIVGNQQSTDKLLTNVTINQISSKTSIHIVCKKDHPYSEDPQARFTEIQKYACQTIWKNPPIWGDQRCRIPGQGSKTPAATVKGIYRGNKVNGAYTAGPCPEGINAWARLSQLWSPSMRDPMQTRLLVFTPNSSPSNSLVQKIQASAQQNKDKQGLPCLQSLSVLPTRSCWIQTTERTPYMAVAITWAQVEQLLGASPSSVRGILRSAPRIAMPKGFPGYSPWARITPHLPI